MFLPVVLASAILLPGLQGPPPPRDAPAQQTGTASVSGRVVAADTGAPIREATVMIGGRELVTSRTVSTGADGRYEFTKLPPGQYRLMVQPSSLRAGYLSLGWPRGDSWGPRVDLATGEKRSGFDIALPKAAAIYGRVVDELGEPLCEVRVEALRRGPAVLERPPGFYGASTDDRGRFRAFGLDPGDYYLKAVVPERGPVRAAGSQEGYLPTYYPSTADLGEALPVTVGRGQEYGEAEIRVVRGRTYHIAGLVLGLDGRPTAEASVSVQYRQEGGVGGRGYSVKPDGTFFAPDLSSGTYTLVAYESGRVGGLVSAPLKVVIGGGDVENVALALTEGVSLRGQIVTEDGSVPGFPLRDLRLTVVPDPSMLRVGPPALTTAKDDWTFEMPGVRGAVLIRTLGIAAPGWRLKAVRYRGADISDEPVEFKEATSPRDLEVVLSNHGATLTGLVTDAAGRPVPHASVVLFPAEPDKRSTSSVRFRSGGADKWGHYRNPVLPPGDYLVVALEARFPLGPNADARAFDRLVPYAQLVTLQGEETRTLDLTVADFSK